MLWLFLRVGRGGGGVRERTAAVDMVNIMGYDNVYVDRWKGDLEERKLLMWSGRYRVGRIWQYMQERGMIIQPQDCC